MKVFDGRRGGETGFEFEFQRVELALQRQAGRGDRGEGFLKGHQLSPWLSKVRGERRAQPPV